MMLPRQSPTRYGHALRSVLASSLSLAAAACGGVAENIGQGGHESTPPSCVGLAANCGPGAGESCCASPRVPGGTFFRSYDGVSTVPNDYTSKAYPATVSGFRLDTYEVTVGRFRKFVEAYVPNMIAGGAGKNPNDPKDPGWDTAWNDALPANARELTTSPDCLSQYWTWTDAPGEHENEPINCISWYVAFALCIWDGGRLPTEAEWNYAAAGGSEQRIYPWGSATPDCSYANFRGAAGGADYCVLPGTGSPNEVGSESPKNLGRWAQADLAGNVAEWNLDSDATPYPQIPCDDCANLSQQTTRVVRGSSFVDDGAFLKTAVRSSEYSRGDSWTGARCARP